MPELKEYVNTQNIQPTDRGTEAFVQQGRRIGAAYNQQAEALRDFANRTGQQIGSAVRDAGDAAVQYQTHREISQGVGSYALMQNSLITRWNDIAKNADPNDPTVAQNFIQNTLTPEMQKWADGFNTEGGQKFAVERQRSLVDHMYEKTAADMGTLAAEAIGNNVRTLGNTLANTAANDPSSVPHLLKQAEESVGALVDSSPNLKGAAAGKAKQQLTQQIQESLVKSGAQSAINKARDPEAEADAQRNKYPQYITPNEGHALGQNARTVIRARDYDNRAAVYYKRQEETEASNQATNEWLIKLSGENPKISGDPNAQGIVNDDRLTKADRWKLLQYREREMKPETNKLTSEQTFIGLMRELRQPDADPQKILNKTWDARLKDAGQPGSLSSTDFDRMRKEIEDRKTPEALALQQDRASFFKRYQKTIDPAMDMFGNASPLGGQRLYQAETDAMRLEKQMRVDGKDPHSLYDPTSPNFFGKPANLDKYTASIQDVQKAKAEALRPKTATEPAAPLKERMNLTTEDQYKRMSPGTIFYDSKGNPWRKPFEMQVPVSR